MNNRKKINIFIILIIQMTGISILSTAQTPYTMQPAPVRTRWAAAVKPDKPLDEYPRPQLERDNWTNLNGLWEYAITGAFDQMPAHYDGRILVPYPVESALSGVKKTLQPDQRLWYRRSVKIVGQRPGERMLLHFGAVDYQCQVYLNGREVGAHEGGYTAFAIDITAALKPGSNDLVVKVYDPSDRGIGPHGKQVLNPGNIYYTPSSGIWQTVWLESVPDQYITSLTITPDIDRSCVNITVHANTQAPVFLEAAGGRVKGMTNTAITVPVKNMKLWSPADPYLYDLKVTAGRDKVRSYFGMRKISIQKDEKGHDRIFLNNQPCFNLGTLDQGFWPAGLYTAPTDEALRFDIEAIKAMGFNTIRKHIKIEPARWYYWADKNGMLVWQDFVNPNQELVFGAKEAFEQQVKETLSQLHNHPSIITWVLFNERWGAYDQQRLAQWVKQQDPHRLINAHSGELLYVNKELRAESDNPYTGSDLADYHSYPDPMEIKAIAGKASVLGEFGGIGVPVPGHQWDDLKGWGYIQLQPRELEKKYAAMMASLALLQQQGLSGSIYTQPFDVEGEENGLLTYDREMIKIPLTRLREIHATLNPALGTQHAVHLSAVQNIDQDDTDDKYAELMKMFHDGKRDSALLRRLTLMALRKKEQAAATETGNAFIRSMQHPFDKQNLQFIYQVTRTSKDMGFEWFRQQPGKLNAILGEGRSEGKVRSIIGVEEVEPWINSGEPDFEFIRKKVAAKYGALGDQYVRGQAMAYYWKLMYTEKSNISKYAPLLGKYYKQYFETALKDPEYNINNVSWKIFQYVTDTSVLAFAVDVMTYAMERWYQADPVSWDTYANLLYKAGQKEKAVFWERQVVQATKGAYNNEEFVKTLERMEQGLPTWPGE